MRAAVAMLAAALCGLGAGLLGQEPAPDRPRPEPEPSAAQRELADRLMQRHAERCRDVRVLVADYVQRRTTALRKEPLVSRGAFLFVRQPACVMFRASAPRVSTVRLTATRYEVFRPQQKRLERFVLDGPELAAGLFAALGGDVQLLQREFELVSCTADEQEPARVRIRLRPRKESVRERLAGLSLTLLGPEAELEAVAYQDQSGDLVEIGLANLQRDPDDPPSAELDVPPGTQVLEHAPPKRRDERGG